MKPDYKILLANRELVRGFFTQRIRAMQKEGLDRDQVINYYKSILDDLKNEKLFDEVIK